MRFVCPEHGDVTCTRIGYSCPATGWCPKCDKMLTDTEGGIRAMTADEAKKARPDFTPNASVSISGDEPEYAPRSCSLFLVICDGKPCAAYPRRLQAEVYASGFSKPVEIVEGIFTANSILDDKSPSTQLDDTRERIGQ